MPLQLYRVIADHAPEPRATVRHMQLTALKRADAQLQHRVQVYAQEAQQRTHDRRSYYNLLIHYHPCTAQRLTTSTATRQQPGTCCRATRSARTPSRIEARSSYKQYLSSGCPKVKLHIRGRETRAESPGRQRTRTATRSVVMTLAAAALSSCTGSAARASRTCVRAHFAGDHIPSAQLSCRAKRKPETSQSTHRAL